MTMEPPDSTPPEGSGSSSPETPDVPPVAATPPVSPPLATGPLPPLAAAPAPPPATAPPPPAAPPPAVAWESPDVVGGPAPGIEFAPHGARLVAYILDGIIIGIVVSVIATIGAIVFFSGATFEGNRLTAVSGTAAVIGSIIFIIAGLVGLLYFPYFWANGGRTLGMRPFNLRVVRDVDGGPIGWGTAILRLIGLWVAGVVFYLGYIWIFIDKRRRGWQDLIAGTVVIKQP
jgi:uncharacterized RDD family membrane protein YckC